MKAKVRIMTARLGSFESAVREYTNEEMEEVQELIQTLAKYCNDGNPGYYTMATTRGSVTFPMTVIQQSVIEFVEVQDD